MSSAQATIEAAIGTYVGIAIPSAVIHLGPMTAPRVEGGPRAAAIRMVSAQGSRLDFAQTLFREAYQVTLYWATSLGRDVATDEWDAFRVLISASPGLTLGNPPFGLERAFVSAMQWGEAFEGHFRIVSATIEVERIE